MARRFSDRDYNDDQPDDPQPPRRVVFLQDQPRVPNPVYLARRPIQPIMPLPTVPELDDDFANITLPPNFNPDDPLADLYDEVAAIATREAQNQPSNNDDPIEFVVPDVEPINVDHIYDYIDELNNNPALVPDNDDRNKLKEVLTSLTAFEDRENHVETIRILFNIFKDKTPQGWAYQVFKFFYAINTQIKFKPTPFSRNFNRWRKDFMTWIIGDEAYNFVDINIIRQFQNRMDIVLYRLNAFHVEAIIDMLLAGDTPQEHLERTRTLLMAGQFSQIEEGPFKESYKLTLVHLCELITVCREIWSLNIKITEILRTGSNYWKRTADGHRFVEAFPYLITMRRGDEAFKSDIFPILEGIYSYMSYYLENYDVKYLNIRLDVKRVLFADKRNKSYDNLREAFWNISINPFSMIATSQDEANSFRRDFWIMLYRNNINALDKRLGTRPTAIARLEALARCSERWPAVLAALKSFSKDQYVEWITGEISYHLAESHNRYQDSFIPDEEDNTDRWSGLMINQYTVTAEFKTRGLKPSAQNPMLRVVPVHCSKAIKHSFKTLARPKDIIPELGSLCLWQAHWSALHYDEIYDKTHILHRLENRAYWLIEDFRRLNEEQQDIFIRGDVDAYRQKIQPPNIITVIYESDDVKAIYDSLPNPHLVRPIAIFDGHAVSSDWFLMLKYFEEAAEKDNQFQEDEEDGSMISHRQGKTIKGIKPYFEEADVQYRDYFFDIETYDIVIGEQTIMVPYLVIVVGKYLSEPLRFWGDYCTDQFLDWIDTIQPKTKVNPPVKLKKGEPRIVNCIWGYNSYKFDLLPFIRKLAAWDEFNLQGSLTNIKTLSIGNNRSNVYTVFYDLLRIIPWGSLDKQAKKWETAHQKMDFDHTKASKEWVDNISPADKEEAIRYCENDCIVLMEVYEKYQAYTHQLYKTNWRVFSTAALGYNVWRGYLYGKNFEIQGVPQKLYPVVQSSYKGGMVFQTMRTMPPNSKEVYMYDINSSYPSVMAQYPMPTTYNGFFDWLDGGDITQLNPDRLIDTDLYTVNGFQWQDDHWIPLLPRRTDTGLSYELKANAVENIWGVELKEAIMSGKIKHGKIVRQYKFNTEYIYQDFVKELYGKRLEAKANKDDLLVDYIKLILNSVYGKKAQQLYPRKMIVTAEKYLYYVGLNATSIIIENTEDLGDGLYMIEFVDIKYFQQIGSNIQIAAFITAAGRAKLANAVRRVSQGFTLKNVLYADTDSIMTLDKLPDDMCDENVLGKWKKEHTFYNVYIVALKCYIGYQEGKAPKMRMKGIPKDCVSEDTFRYIKHLPEVLIDTGVLWKRNSEGYVEKIVTRKYMKHNPKRLYISDYESYPYSYNGEN